MELEDTPDDLRLLDQALDEAIAEAGGEQGGVLPVVKVGPEAGLFLGAVIIAAVPAARWQLWPNGHPVIRLPSGRDLDVVELGNDRVTNGAPLLADIYSAAAGSSSARAWWLRWMPANAEWEPVMAAVRQMGST